MSKADRSKTYFSLDFDIRNEVVSISTVNFTPGQMTYSQPFTNSHRLDGSSRGDQRLPFLYNRLRRLPSCEWVNSIAEVHEFVPVGISPGAPYHGRHVSLQSLRSQPLLSGNALQLDKEF